MESVYFHPKQGQTCPPNGNEIHFTPVKNSHVPRAWERKPSTSFLARSRPRKVWKRFRSSFNSMKALQQLVTPDASRLKESDLALEINTRRHTEYSRGIKRQCLATRKSSAEDDEDEISGGRGRSFLETKWEEVSRKRRKLPATPNTLDEHMIVDDPQVDEDDEMSEIGDYPGGTTSSENSAAQGSHDTDESLTLTPASSDAEAAYPDVLPGEAERLPSENLGVTLDIKSLDNVDREEVLVHTTTDAADSAAATKDEDDVEAAADQQLQSDVATITQATESQETMTEPVELTAEQESTLVRSALRSSIDGDDTTLLNNFLSKAKAKREAKAAAEAEAPTGIASDHEEKEQDPEPEPEPEKQDEEDLPTPQHQVFVEIPTPERRVLEALDANSPSPSKSPSKSTEKDEKTGDNGSPVARRSTRVRSLQRPAAPTGLRTALSLRRARGNEFVFLQRTEAQELALQTRRNTKQNKGEALLPKYTLQGLAKKTPDASPVTDDGKKQRNSLKKYVSWNEERLVEVEGEESDDELAKDPKTTTTAKTAEKKKAANSRTSQSQASLKIGAKTAAAATTASPTAATRGRRLRRLGPPKFLELSDNSEAASPSSPITASPGTKRKKLTPKSPKQTITRPKTPSKLPTATPKDNEVPSLLSSGRSVKTNLLKVNAGSTPMPRRVRRT